MNDQAHQIVRIDPCHSKVFSWIEYNPNALEVRDEATNRLIQPEGPAITARYRTTGMEMTAWPITESEATRIMRPGAEFDYSSGRAWSQIVMPYKSKSMVKSGDRQETKKQREEVEQRAGRRWLA
jgi:hypothetical protein